MKKRNYPLKGYPKDVTTFGRALPIFKGYTVDGRLKEFRKVKQGPTIEFIDFDSEKGQQLVAQIAHLAKLYELLLCFR